MIGNKVSKMIGRKFLFLRSTSSMFRFTNQKLFSSTFDISDQKISRTSDVTQIPVIDLGPSFDNELGKKKIAKELANACINCGFYLIKNHGVPNTSFENALNQSKNFFDLPKSEKIKVSVSDTYPYGYQAAEKLDRTRQTSQTQANSYGVSDIKQSFTVCLGPGDRNPHKQMCIPQWPENSSSLQNSVTKYYRQVEFIANHLLKLKSLGLGMEENYLLDRSRQHVSALRILNYPAQDKAEFKPQNETQIRASAHSDYGTLTILKDDGVSGLQVLGKNQQWIPVTLPNDCFTVNIGDMLARWTNDLFKSTLHRVVNPEPQFQHLRRNSMAYFHNPDPDAVVETMQSCIDEKRPKKYQNVRSYDYLMAKFYTGYQPDKTVQAIKD